eukprot:EG_transcript_19218
MAGAALWDFLVHPATVVWGAGLYGGCIDVSTQALELKLNLVRERKPPADGLAGLEGGEAEEEPPEKLTCETWDAPRTVRMSFIASVQGFISVLYLSAINHTMGDELSWQNSLRKTAMGFILQPTFFVLNTAIVETLKHCGFNTIVPKIKQDFGYAFLLSVIWLPISFCNYLLFTTPTAQTLFCIIPDIFIAIGMNYLYNRGLIDRPKGDGEAAPVAEDSPPEPVTKPTAGDGTELDETAVAKQEVVKPAW